MATLRELVTKLTFKVDRAALKLAAKLLDNVGKSAEEIKAKTEKAERALKNIGNVAKGVGAALAGAFAVAGVAVLTAGIQLIKFNDAVKGNIASIGILGGDMDKATDRFKEILGISERTGESVDELTKLYGKLSMAGKDLGASNADIMTGLEVIAQAGVLGRTSTGARQGALLQLGQAFGSATVQAEEYNSIMDGLPLLHQQIAKSMNMSATQLSRFIKDTKKTGGITGKQLFKAVLESQFRMDEMFKQTPLTLDRVINRLNVLKMLLVLDLKESFTVPDAFLKELNSAVTRMREFVLANKDLIGLGIKAVFEGMSFALKAVEAAIVEVVKAIRWITENKELVKVIGIALAIIALIPSFIALSGAILAIVEGVTAFVAAFTYASAILGVVGAIIAGLNLPMIAIVGAIALMTAGILAFVTNLGGFRDKAIGAFNAVRDAVMRLLNAGKNMFNFFANLKLPEIQIKGKWSIPKMPSYASMTGGGATSTPPAGRSPASSSAGAGAGSKSFTNTANTTVNINGGGITPSRARQLGAGFSAGSLSGFRALEVHGV
jgi:tape measure domain-containing protein